MTAVIDDEIEATEVAADGREFDEQAFADLVTNAIGDPEALDAKEPGDDLEALILYYQALSRSAKMRARNWIAEDARREVLEGNLETSQALFKLKDRIIQPIRKTRARKPKRNSSRSRNRTLATVHRIASIQLAYSLAMLKAHGDPTLDHDWQEQVAKLATTEAQERAAEYVEWIENDQRGDEPDIPDVEKAAARISLGRASKARGRRPVAATPEESVDIALAELVGDAPAAGVPEAASDAPAAEVSFPGTEEL